jgi:hypothetical protein
VYNYAAYKSAACIIRSKQYTCLLRIALGIFDIVSAEADNLSARATKAQNFVRLKKQLGIAVLSFYPLHSSVYANLLFIGNAWSPRRITNRG